MRPFCVDGLYNATWRPIVLDGSVALTEPTRRIVLRAKLEVLTIQMVRLFHIDSRWSLCALAD